MFVIALSFYYVGYILWFFRIPKSIFGNFNNWLEEKFFEKEIRKINREIEDESRSSGGQFERGRDPKDAMGVGNKLARKKQKLFKKFRTAVGSMGLFVLSMVLLWILFWKVALIFTIVLVVLIVIFLIDAYA